MKRPTFQPAQRAAASRALWFVRWMLVLILVWDQVGSPLHHHRHDSGVDVEWTHVTHTHEADESEHGSSVSHGVLALRFQSEGDLQADDPGTQVAIATAIATNLLSSAPTRQPLPAYSRPPWSGDPRSLRPEGRAPPLLG